MEIGDIKRGYEVGIKSNNKHQYIACADCGEKHWVPFVVSTGEPRFSGLCRKCAGLRRRGEKREQAYNRLDLVGQRFTRLVVLDDVGNCGKSRESLWRSPGKVSGVVSAIVVRRRPRPGIVSHQETQRVAGAITKYALANSSLSTLKI
jgi:hypothetical protein